MIAITITTFDPRSDGFAFVNSWTFDDREIEQMRRVLVASCATAAAIFGTPLSGAMALVAARILRSWLNDVIASSLPSGFGLCAGMSYAALDYFQSERKLPRGRHINDQPSWDTTEGWILRSYLWKRQMDSLRSDAAKYLAWGGALHAVPRELGGGHPWLLQRTREEWEKLKHHIDAGRPWPIGLVGTTKNPFENHAVIAYGYEQNDSDSGKLFLYDPNLCSISGSREARHETEFMFGETMLEAQETCSSQRRGPLRGFFVYDYESSTPPNLEEQESGEGATIVERRSVTQVHRRVRPSRDNRVLNNYSMESGCIVREVNLERLNSDGNVIEGPAREIGTDLRGAYIRSDSVGTSSLRTVVCSWNNTLLNLNYRIVYKIEQPQGKTCSV